MSVKRQFNYFSGLREDIPFLKSIESSVSADFDDALRGVLIGITTPYLIRGFAMVLPSSSVPANQLQINTSDSAVLHPTATESGTILRTLPSAGNVTLSSVVNPNQVIGSFVANATNYVGLDYYRAVDNTTLDLVKAWSPSQKTEYQREAALGRIMNFRFVISTNGFSTYLPLYIVQTDASNNATSITKAANGFFRLGSGGAAPNPFNQWAYPTNPQTGTNREWVSPNTSLNPMSVQLGSGSYANAFTYGDWSISNLKQWCDAVMTRFIQVTGSSYWYTDSSNSSGGISLYKTWFDSIGSALTGAGSISYNLILQGTEPTVGAWQALQNNSNLLLGDSYVIGTTSGNTAYVQSFNGNQLQINSQSQAAFTSGETLQNRIKIRFNSTLNSLLGLYVDSENRFAIYSRTLGAITGTTFNISAATSQGFLVTVTTTAAHGFQPGQIVNTTGIASTSSTLGSLNGSQTVASVLSSTQFQFFANEYNTGSLTLTSATVTLDFNQSAFPYIPKLSLQPLSLGVNWTFTPDSTSVGYGILKVSAQNNTITAPSTITTTATFNSSTPRLVTVASTVGMQIGDFISGTNIPANTQISSIASSTTFYISQAYTGSTGSETVTFNRAVFISGLDNTAHNAPSGWYILDAVPLTNQLSIRIPDGYAPTVGGEVFLSNPYVSPEPYNFTVSITGAAPNDYDLINVTGTAFSPSSFRYNIGSTSSVQPNPATGPIVVDGVVAISTVSNAVSPNPFPGPIAWDYDIIDKAIVGDLRFTIPQSAKAVGFGSAAATANQFNVNGTTGTIYLNDGEVAYIALDRNNPVSGGVSYSTAGGSNPITGSIAPVRLDGTPLQVGDFVKFSGEDDIYWLRIGSITGNSMSLVTNAGSPPIFLQRPAASGTLVYSRGSYPIVYAAPHDLVPSGNDTYWLGFRRDNGSQVSKVYLRDLQLAQGESRQVNNNETNNMLLYTGAGTEAATEPNYTVADTTGNWKYTQTVQLSAVDTATRRLYFSVTPALGFQKGDVITYTTGGSTYTFTVNFLYTSGSIGVYEDVTILAGASPPASMTYYCVDYSILDSDNLTLAIRKEDRELAKVNTELNRPVYDEGVYPQLMTLTGSGTIRSGSFIYTGSQNAPTAFGYVLHGTANVNEVIEGATIQMPGGYYSSGTQCLVHVYYGTFSGVISQNGLATGLTYSSLANTTIPATVEIVLPPNRRNQEISGTGTSTVYSVFPTAAAYKTSSNAFLQGEELIVISNDQTLECNVNYTETFGGPKGKIAISSGTTIASGARLRFRNLGTIGSVIASATSSVSLQQAYNAGNVINTLSSTPVQINSGGSNTGVAGLGVKGSIAVDGSGAGTSAYGSTGVPGGIFPTSDGNMVIGSETYRIQQNWTELQKIKSTTGFTGSAWTQFTAGQTTTNATVTAMNASNVTVPAGSAIRYKATIVVRDSTDAGSCMLSIECGFKRTSSGSPVASGSPVSTIIGAEGSLIGAYAYADVSTNDIIVQLVGLAGVTAYWAACIESQIVQTST